MRSAHALLAGLAVLVLAGTLSLAQTDGPKRSPLAGAGAERTQAQQRPAQPQGVLEQAWMALVIAQRDLTSGMTDAVRRMQADPVGSTVRLALLSFIYGILHAVGPGHGKFVISSYALANERTVRRGITLSFMAALIQALSAIVLVGAATAIFRATSVQMRATEAWLETASWALVALVGAWLLWRQVAPLWAARPAVAHAHHGHSHDHGHDHGHDHVHHAHAHGQPAAVCTVDHVHDEHCGHVHLPAPEQLEGKWSWREAWSLAFSIGIRPCTGAILVLIFAASIGLFWAGVFSAFAMAVGTAITVSALAAIAVGSRNLAARLAGADSLWSRRISQGAGLVGAALVMVLGVAGVVASLSGSVPL